MSFLPESSKFISTCKNLQSHAIPSTIPHSYSRNFGIKSTSSRIDDLLPRGVLYGQRIFIKTMLTMATSSSPPVFLERSTVGVSLTIGCSSPDEGVSLVPF